LVKGIALFVGALPGVAPALADEPKPPYRITESPGGTVSVEASGADLTPVLDEIAAMGGFEITMNRRIERPPVSAAIRDADVADAVRRVLRRRNYALVYGDDGRLARVIVLSPPDREALEDWRAKALRQAQERRVVEERRAEQRRRAEKQRAKQRLAQKILQQALARSR
jgi:hypothetical protein